MDPPIAEMSRERETNSGKNLIRWTATVSIAMFFFFIIIYFNDSVI